MGVTSGSSKTGDRLQLSNTIRINIESPVLRGMEQLLDNGTEDPDSTEILDHRAHCGHFHVVAEL